MTTAEQIHEVSEGPFVLSDGSAAVIRRLTSADLPAVRRLHELLPSQDIYLRFFGFSRHAAREAARLVVGADSVAVGLFRDGCSKVWPTSATRTRRTWPSPSPTPPSTRASGRCCSRL